MEQMRTEQASLLSQNQEMGSKMEQLEGQVRVAVEEKSGAVQRVKELEDKMLDVEKENTELKRRIELISNLRNSSSGGPAASHHHHHHPHRNRQGEGGDDDDGDGSVKGTE